LTFPNVPVSVVPVQLSADFCFDLLTIGGSFGRTGTSDISHFVFVPAVARSGAEVLAKCFGHTHV